MEPTHTRLDPLALISTALLQGATHPVVTDMDAGMDPIQDPVTVVQVPNVTPASPLTRWSFQVSVTLSTFAESSATAWGAHTEVADAMLDLSGLDGGRVRVSSVTCTLEPVNITGRTAPQWPGLVSTYTLFIREAS